MARKISQLDLVEAVSGEESVPVARDTSDGPETVRVPLALLVGPQGEPGTVFDRYLEHDPGTAFTVDIAVATMHLLPTTGNTAITLPDPVGGRNYALLIAFGGGHALTLLGGGIIRWEGGGPPNFYPADGTMALLACTCTATHTLVSLAGIY